MKKVTGTSEREMSCFFVRELFPLYLENHLDKIRLEQVKDHLTQCQDCKKFYEKLTARRDQIAELFKTQVSPAMIEYLKQEHHFWNDLIKHIGWNRWPTSVRWMTELSLVTVVLFSIIHFFPWLSFVKTVQRMRPKPPQVVFHPETEPLVAPVTAPTPVAMATAQPTPNPTAAVPAKPIAVARQEPEDSEENDAETAGVFPSNNQKATGYVWRGSLKVDDIAEDTEGRITKIVTDLGGTKAGKVELGYHPDKSGKSLYYHFILPEENYEKLLSTLNTEGLVQLTKEKHPRIIKSGHMRIIMTVDENEEETEE